MTISPLVKKARLLQFYYSTSNELRQQGVAKNKVHSRQFVKKKLPALVIELCEWQCEWSIRSQHPSICHTVW
jgi:hypothetical protein